MNEENAKDHVDPIVPVTSSEKPSGGAITLSAAQKAIAMKYYSREDVTTLARRIWNNPKLDYRSPEVGVIKAYLAGENVSFLTNKKFMVAPLELTEEHKQKIEDLAHKVDSTVELTRLVFGDPGLKHLSREWRAVYSHYKTIYPQGIKTDEEPVDETEYSPPDTLSRLVGLINEYVPTGDPSRKLYHWGNLKLSEERQIRGLMAYMRVFRFKYQASEYQKQVDRALFISTFIRFTHDKPDLTQEEQDQYISSAVETVNIANIDRDLLRISSVIEEIMSGDRESRGQFMPVVELINTTRGKLDQAKGRLQNLLDSLVGTRSKRLKDRDQRNSSVLNFFDAWMKDEQLRNDTIDLGIKEKEEDVREVGRIRDVDDIVCIIAGQTEEEAGLG